MTLLIHKKLYQTAYFIGYLQDQGRVLTNTGSWLRDWSSESWDFIPFGSSSLIAPAETTQNIGIGFVANGSMIIPLPTNQPAFFICERTGKK